MLSDEAKILCEIRELLKNGNGNTIDSGADKVIPDLFVAGIKNERPQELTGNNRSRIELWIHNAADVDLYIGPTDSISSNRYSLRIAPYDAIIMNANNYTQLYKRKIYGFWEADATNDAKAMITEFSLRS